VLARDDPEEAARKKAAQDYADALKDYERTGVDTSIADALTEVPLLDVYNPGSFAPLGEMPRLPFRGYYLVAPGRYELDAAVFCLHAGAYAPGGGDGYALAPLRGIGANLIYTVLYRWLTHTEIPQHDIQLMLWGIVDRVSPDKLSAELLANVKLLLRPTEIDAWRKLARPADPPAAPGSYDEKELERLAGEMGITVPVTPDQLRSRISSLEAKRRAAGLLPGAAGRILRQIEDAKAQLARAEALANQPGGLFGGVAGPLLQQAGVPYAEIERVAAPFGDPKPPEGSREIPLCRWSYDAPAGLFVRHIPIEGYWRALVQVAAPGPYGLTRDAAGRITGLVGYRGDRVEVDYTGDLAPIGGQDGLKSARVAQVRYVPVAGSAKAWSKEGVVVVGQPSAKGGAKDKVLSQRIETVRTLSTQVLGIAKTTLERAGESPAKPLTWTGPLDALDLASLVEAFQGVAGYQPVTDPKVAHDRPPSGPEAAALELLCEAVQAAIRVEVDTLAGLKRYEYSVGLRTPLGTGGYAVPALSDPDDWGGPNPFDPANKKKGPTLPQYDASGSVAQPGNTGRQRLATAAKGSNASEGSSPGDSPGSWFGSWLDWLIEVFTGSKKGLSNDPPRDDFESLDVPPPPVLPPGTQPEGSSADRWTAEQGLLAGLVTCYQDSRSAKISLDRMGGAVRADRDPWVWAQAQALTHYKRQLGLDMVALADAVDRYRQVLVAEGVDDAPVPAGGAADDLAVTAQQAAEVLGVPVEELAAARAARVQDGAAVGRLEALAKFAASLRAEGGVWSRLPEVPLPATPGTPVAMVGR
jgi:hypothetical protein